MPVIPRAPADFVRRLEAELVLASGRHERRSRRMRRAGVLAGVASLVVLALAVPILTGDGLAPAIAVERRGAELRLRLLGDDAQPAAVAEDLREAGIAADVRAVPVSPSLEGRWLSLAADESTRTADDGVTLVIDGPVEGLVLTYGRAAEPGESYEMTASAFAPGEALHCVDLVGRPAHQVAEALAERALDVFWREHLPMTTEAREAPPDGVVVDVVAESEGAVMVFVADPRVADDFIEPIDDAACANGS